MNTFNEEFESLVVINSVGNKSAGAQNHWFRNNSIIDWPIQQNSGTIKKHTDFYFLKANWNINFKQPQISTLPHKYAKVHILYV